jgi:hypothetical protein
VALAVGDGSVDDDDDDGMGGPPLPSGCSSNDTLDRRFSMLENGSWLARGPGGVHEL